MELLLEATCSLCSIPFSTETCPHLLDLGDGRIVISRKVWEELIEDRFRLRTILDEGELT